MPKPSDLSFRESARHFDHDLNQILDRIYGSSSNRSDLDTSASDLRRLIQRRERDSLELKQALNELRGLRERSQGVMRMKEELSYLQDQIHRLHELGNEINSLRHKLNE